MYGNYMIYRVECVCAMTVRTGMPTKNIQNNEGNLCEFSLFFHRFQVSNSVSKSDVISGWKKVPKMSAKSMPKSLEGDKGRPAGRRVVIENDFRDVSVGQNWGPEKQIKNHAKTTPGIRVPLAPPPPQFLASLGLTRQRKPPGLKSGFRDYYGGIKI